jgi:hypothetical protein
MWSLTDTIISRPVVSLRGGLVDLTELATKRTLARPFVVHSSGSEYTIGRNVNTPRRGGALP